MTLYSISVCQKPWRITTLKLSLGVTKLQASLERLEEYLEGQLSQRRALQVEYLEGQLNQRRALQVQYLQGQLKQRQAL